MITIKDDDLPITVAAMLVTGRKENDDDMFMCEELQEIAAYLIEYCNRHMGED